MDKRKLNNEIILCRPIVRKAKVAVIRKLLKKMKILKACKSEVVREKKVKKSERLFEKVQIMKKIKDDEVTKFALQTKNVDDFLKGPKISLRQNALACLAKHKAVLNKIISIKQQIPNWELELPLLLDSLGKKKSNYKTNILKSNLKELNSSSSSFRKSETHQINKKFKKNENNLEKNCFEKSRFKDRKSIQKKYTLLQDDNKGQNIGQDKNQNSITDKILENMGKIEKIDDPFFIEKKVTPSKLISTDLSTQKSLCEVDKLKNFKKKEINNSQFFKKSCQFEMQKLLTESKKEELHPSWAAKKVNLIKPFQGTKIKFSDS